MRTNKEKFNHYYGIIRDAEKEFIAGAIQDIPKKLYSEQYGKLAEWRVEGVLYFGKIYQEDKPTRSDVEKIKSYSENIPDMTEDKIRFYLKEVCEIGSSSHAIKTSEVGLSYFHQKEDAQKIIDVIQEKKKQDDELLANGHTKCAYCGKITKNSDLVPKKIIFRTRNHYGKACVGEKTNKYCSSKCGSHDQMAHEG